MFSLVPSLRSIDSAPGDLGWFADFFATVEESDFSAPCIIGFGSSPSQCAPAHYRRAGQAALASSEISRFPRKERPCMPGSPTTPGCSGACLSAPDPVAFRRCDSVGARNIGTFAVQWLACTLPYRRFADILADACARLGADVVRYTFIVMDLHLLLLAGLPAHRIIAFVTDSGRWF
jgi:hypothetical protein